MKCSLHRLICLLLLPLLLLVGCGSTDSEGEPAASGNSAGGAAPSDGLDGVTVQGEPGAEPEVEIEDGFSVDETTVEVLDQGDGEEVGETDTVTVDYVGVNASTGKTFDSSWERGMPADFPLGPGMISGFNKALAGQQVGSRLVAALPPADGYGEAGNPQADIGGEDTLVFVVEIQGIVPSQAEGATVQPPEGLPDLELNAQDQPTGFSADADTEPAAKQLQVHTVIEGEGPEVEKGQTLTVHYLGQIYPDGKIFDQSWTRGEPATFPIGTGNLIEGWDEGLVGQKVGSRVILVVPPDKGYGEEGQPQAGIKGTDTLIFAIDILQATSPSAS